MLNNVVLFLLKFQAWFSPYEKESILVLTWSSVVQFVPCRCATSADIFPSAFLGLDYKKLTTVDSPLQVLKPVLTSANVHLLAKLATKIPTKVSYCTSAWNNSKWKVSIVIRS